MIETLNKIGITCGILILIISAITIYYLYKDLAKQKKEMNESSSNE